MKSYRAPAALLSAALSFSAASAAHPARAEQLAAADPKKGEVIERIVAVVNGDPMLLSELRTRAAPFLGRVMQAPETQRMQLMQQLYGDLLTQLIDERLLEQEARKLSISITAVDVDRAIQNVQRQSGLKDADFWDAVKGQGFNPDQYKADVRRQLVRLKVMNQKVRSRVNITEDDVRRKYDEMSHKARKSARFETSHVFLAVEGESVAKLSQVRAEAAALRQQLTPANFDDMAKEHGGGSLGWVSQQDLPSELAEVLIGLEPGQISEPVRGPAGIHIFWLKQRQEGDSTIGSYEEMKQNLFSEMLEGAMARQEVAYLAELRKQALISRRL